MLLYHVCDNSHIRRIKPKLYHQAARSCDLLSHPTRLQILDELRRDKACVCHLQAVLKRPQAYACQRLWVLREAGAVTDRKDGQLVYYRLDDSHVEQLVEHVLGPVESSTHPVKYPFSKCTPEASHA